MYQDQNLTPLILTIFYDLKKDVFSKNNIIQFNKLLPMYSVVHKNK